MITSAATRVEASNWHTAIAAVLAGGYTYFDFLIAVDESDGEERGDQPAGYDLFVHLINPHVDRHDSDAVGGLRSRLLVTRVADGASVDSLTDLIAGTAWHERQAHEMFGLEFDGFEDGTGLGLRPLLLPPGFEGHPLRKSFQLAARAVRPWPGGKEPGEGHGTKSPSRRRIQAPGVPDPSWGPRPAPGAEDGAEDGVEDTEPASEPARDSATPAADGGASE